MQRIIPQKKKNKTKKLKMLVSLLFLTKEQTISNMEKIYGECV